MWQISGWVIQHLILLILGYFTVADVLNDMDIKVDVRKLDEKKGVYTTPEIGP